MDDMRNSNDILKSFRQFRTNCLANFQLMLGYVLMRNIKSYGRTAREDRENKGKKDPSSAPRFAHSVFHPQIDCVQRLYFLTCFFSLSVSMGTLRWEDKELCVKHSCGTAFRSFFPLYNNSCDINEFNSGCTFVLYTFFFMYDYLHSSSYFQ